MDIKPQISEKKELAIDSKKISHVALKVFFNITEKWNLKTDDQMKLLGSPSRSTFFKWKKEKSALLSRDTLERISHIISIYKSLQILLSGNKSADEWVNRPNAHPLFGGRSAMDRMLSGDVADLFVVREYLDAERGGWS